MLYEFSMLLYELSSPILNLSQIYCDLKNHVHLAETEMYFHRNI